jgi:hypothetical protein
VALPPTEAEVERAFSKLKRMVPRLRANLAPERVEGALILMSLLDGEDEEATTTWTTDDSPLSVHSKRRMIGTGATASCNKCSTRTQQRFNSATQTSEWCEHRNPE